MDTYDLSAYGADGIYALPNELNVDAIFYNKALFEKAGIEKVPETMDELYDAIDKQESLHLVWVVKTHG